MKERLLEFLRNENKSSAQLAEEIGVQPSGISHILSGRNNPSLDFVLKMLEKYKFLSSDWLLFGKGSMYKESGMKNLFDQDFANTQEISDLSNRNEQYKQEPEKTVVNKSKTVQDSVISANSDGPEVIKIVWFYEDNCFEEFFPRK
jgi:transcriptional regulator with XRE-family HTH domain